MIIINTKGGLGNQLFQMAISILVSEFRPNDVFVYNGGYQNYSYGHRYLMCDWNSNLRFPVINHNLMPKTLKFFREPSDGQMHLSTIQSIRDILAMEKDVFLDGYWANEGYLAAHRSIEFLDFLRPEIVDNDLIQLGQQIRDSHTIGVHVRRHEYGHHGLARLSYYLNAIEDIRRHSPQSRIMVFTDEPNFARFVFKDVPNLVVVNPNLLEPKRDFFMLSCCEHFILSNSTFSFWAARLGMAKSSKIFFPHPYCVFNEMELFSAQDLPWKIIKNVVTPP